VSANPLLITIFLPCFEISSFVDPIPFVSLQRAPRATDLLSRNPLHTGWVGKRGSRCICLATWKPRFLILKGAYLFKYASDEADVPIGAPIPIVDAKWQRIESDDPARPHGFSMTLVRKRYMFSVGSNEEVTEWLRVLSDQRIIAYKQMMGHLPCSQDDNFANGAGELLTKRRLTQSAAVNQHVDSHQLLMGLPGNPGPL
jgi:PH domain